MWTNAFAHKGEDTVIDAAPPPSGRSTAEHRRRLFKCTLLLPRETAAIEASKALAAFGWLDTFYAAEQWALQLSSDTKRIAHPTALQLICKTVLGK